jgi:hypothetical protein
MGWWRASPPHFAQHPVPTTMNMFPIAIGTLLLYSRRWLVLTTCSHLISGTPWLHRLGLTSQCSPATLQYGKYFACWNVWYLDGVIRSSISIQRIIRSSCFEFILTILVVSFSWQLACSSSPASVCCISKHTIQHKIGQKHIQCPCTFHRVLFFSLCQCIR